MTPQRLFRVVLAFFIVSFVLGGTIIGALTIRRWPWQLALTLPSA